MPRTLLLISYTLFSISLHAQYAATIELFEPVGDVLYTIGADVNEDGASDVICATNERLCWLEQLPDGTFSKHRLIAESGYYYRTLVMADIDEDGHQDLVFASTELGIGAHLNLGGGHWGPVIPLYDEGAVIDCYLADLNEDDHVDIMLARAGGVWWMAGQGDATFGPAQLISDQHANTNSLHAEDLDGDGDEDILVAAFSNKRLAWHQNLGSGNFGDYQIIDTVYAGPRSVITADFDGDEQPDIACAYRSEDEGGAGLVWYRNLGGGDFALVDTLMGRGFHEYVQAADMDGDNDMDLVSCHGLDEMDWLANDGAGHFSEPIELERYAAYLRQVDLHDLNADGYPDVLYGISSTSPQKENLLWRASTGPGAFAPPALLTIGARTASIPQVADIDQDGLSDIVVGLDGPDALVWLKNEGHGFSPAHLIARRHNYNPGSIAIADINNDGWPDVLAGSIADNATNASQFCFYVNDGDGSFTAMPPFESFYYPQRDMHVVDMDGDGDLDMLWASPGYNFQANSSLGWVRNDGSSWSDPIILLSEVVVIADVLPTDLDADGQLDLIICKQDAPQLIRMEHTGGGNFSIQQQI
ncbi:MAG: VCBS repeat-containing protein, partial [Lewinella sp.]|nr:VCBS repeat-containing protein [Lewinella sp.]